MSLLMEYHGRNLPMLRILSALTFNLLVGTFALLAATPPLAANELHDAVRASDAVALKALLEAGAKVDESDYFVGTALHAAVSQGSVDIARILIEHGADLEAESEQLGARAVHLAASFGDVAMLELLLDSGAELNAQDDQGKTALHRAANFGGEEAVALLLNRGADIEQKDSLYGRPPLVQAAVAGKIRIVTLLVEGGAEIEATDNDGRTALRLAAYYSGGVELMDYLTRADAYRDPFSPQPARDNRGLRNA